ncbi:MAG: hypothetical protein JSU07_12045 [Bacteroidetes bacterium]|nr:hypothetical protein [Bacteroidota bacterium]
MKKITLSFSAMCITAAIIMSCSKKAAVSPKLDQEFQTSINAVYANTLVYEIDDIVGYASENWNNLNSKFFNPAPATTGGSISISVAPAAPSGSLITITYNSTVTCIDGKKRSGSILINSSPSNTVWTAQFYRNPGYKSIITFNNYYVDGYHIDNMPGSTLTISNNMPISFNQSTTPLNWTIAGNLSLWLPNPSGSASTDSMTWHGSFTKSLVNSTSAVMASQTSTGNINWSPNTTSTLSLGATLNYTVNANGYLKSANTTYSISNATGTPLYRSFLCSPESFSSISSYSVVPYVTPNVSEWHPVTGGMLMSTITGDSQPRYVDFASGAAAPACDNSATIRILGNTYPVTLRK